MAEGWRGSTIADFLPPPSPFPLPPPPSVLSLQGATDNLAEANVIGSGGFGRVYCGRLAGAGVAVKVLEAGSSQGDREFQAEVRVPGRGLNCDQEFQAQIRGTGHAIVYHSPTCNLIPHPLVLQQVVLLIESTQVAASGASGGLLQCRGEQGAGVQSHVSPPSPPSLPSPPSHHPISLVGGAAESAQVAPSIYPAGLG
ncbi:unnamed protein product [Closterium sp. NIES-54]